MIPHRIMNGSIVIHDAASAAIENLHFAVGQENTLEVVIPFVQFLVELSQDLILEVSYLRRVQKDLVSINLR